MAAQGDQMFRTILVPLDGSERAEKILPYVEGGHGATAEQIADTLVNTVLEQTYPKEQ
jgi:hypothetical protein